MTTPSTSPRGEPRRRRLTRRDPAPPDRGSLPGFKIAYPMVSADSTQVGFNGVALGRTQVYGATADATCIQSARHRCPSSWCDCGFYCFHSAAEARALGCDPQYQHSVLLEVLASGRFIRYEKGLRYERQTVRAVRVGRCACGRGAAALADVGAGTVGWRRLRPVCGLCAGLRQVLSLAAFGGLAGRLEVTGDAGIDDSVFAPLGPTDRSATPSRPADARHDTATRAGVPGPEVLDVDDASLVPLLSAEVTLLQARLDEVQRRLDHLTRRGH